MANKILTGGELKAIIEECAPSAGTFDWDNFNAAMFDGNLSDTNQCVYKMANSETWEGLWETCIGSINIIAPTMPISGMTNNIETNKLYALEDMTFDPRERFHMLNINKTVPVILTGATRSNSFGLNDIRLRLQSDTSRELLRCGYVNTNNLMQNNTIIESAMVYYSQIPICTISTSGLTSVSGVSVTFVDTSGNNIITLNQTSSSSSPSTITCMDNSTSLTINNIKQLNNLSRINITGTFVGQGSTPQPTQYYTFNLTNGSTLYNTNISLSPIYDDESATLYSGYSDVAVAIFNDTFSRLLYKDNANTTVRYSNGILTVLWDDVHSLFTNGTIYSGCVIRVCIKSNNIPIVLYYRLETKTMANGQKADIASGDSVYLDISNEKSGSLTFPTLMRFKSTTNGALPTNKSFYIYQPVAGGSQASTVETQISGYASSKDRSNSPNPHYMHIKPNDSTHYIYTYNNSSQLRYTYIPTLATQAVNFIPNSNYTIIQIAQMIYNGTISYRYN